MKVYIANISVSIAIVWLITSLMLDWTFSGVALIILLFIVYVVLWLISWFYSKTHFTKMLRIAILFIYFIKELIMASLKVAYDILTPNFLLKPGIVAFPLSAETDLEITLLANMISLTPGTLSIAVSEDRKILYIHSLYITEGKKSVIEGIKSGFERRILEITR